MLSGADRPGWRVRRLTPEDITAFSRLRLEALGRFPDAFGADERDERSQAARLHAAWLAEDHVAGVFHGEELVGTATFAAATLKKMRHKGYVYAMYVADAAQGTGAADALMVYLLEKAAAEVETLLLTVVASNSRARAFYEKHGFEAYGTEPDALRTPDASLDEVLMRRRRR